MRTLARVAFLAGSAGSAMLLAQVTLPAPHGEFAVGRTALFWADQSRLEDAIPEANKPREIAAFFYYPAVANGEPAQYFPGLAGLESAPETRVLRLQFGGAWPTVAAGAVRTHAYIEP